MKTAFKRVLSFLLVLTMVFGTVGAEISGIDFADIFSFKAEAASYSGKCGDNVNWSLDTSTGVLDITGTGAMWDYSSVSYLPWYSYSSSINTVNIASGVTTICKAAFYDCYRLTSITFGENSQMTTIGSNAFKACERLLSVTIPGSVTTIGDSAFAACIKLTSVTIPDSVTTIGSSAFESCYCLTSVTIPDSVTTIGSKAFNFCTSLTSITVDTNNKNYSSDSYGVLFNKNKTKLIQYPIGNTRTSYTIPDSVTTIGNYAFYVCDSLTSVIIPDSVTTIGDWAFNFCKSLTSVTIGNSVTTIGGSAFRYCQKLTDVTIGNNVTTIASEVFAYCDSLTSVTIPDSVITIGGSAFIDCDSLEYVHIPASVTSIGSRILDYTSAYICSDTEDCYAKTYADNKSIEFKLCDGHGVEPAKKITDCEQGDIIEFGWYPQSEVTDTALISALNSSGGEWISYNYYSGTGSTADGKMTAGDYMRYKDVVYGSEKYRGIVFDSYRPYYTGYTCSADNSYQDDNGYTTGTVYWFKYEPIQWRVLDPAAGLVMAETVIDAQPYNNYLLSSGYDEYGKTAYWGDSSKTYYANDYAESSIRQWLNDDFYNTAFSPEQQNIIEYTTLDNSAYSSSYSAYDSETTNDKIYLLSYNDAKNTSYGFSSSTGSDSTRRAEPTAYAMAQGVYVYSDYGTSLWWLRTPGYYSNYACYIDSYGGYVYSDGYVNDFYGIRPAFKLNLNSEILQSEKPENITLTKIEIKTLPTKTEYFVGDTLDTTGLTLTATYNNGTTETITNGFTCSPTTLDTAGKQTITVSYGGKTCTFEVTVKAVELTKIEVKTLPTKTEYFVGDMLDTTGLTLTATYNNGTTETITSGFDCTPTTLDTAGTQTITVTYGGKTCTFEVTVKEKPVSNDYSVTYMVNGKRYAKYIVTVGDPVPAPAVNPIVDGMIFEGWSPEIVQLMPANDLVYTAVFHKHVYTGSIAIHPTCTQHGVMLYTCSCGDSYNEIIPALGHDWGRWITVVEATPSSNGQKVRYCSRCGAAEYDVIPAPSANFRVETIADQEYTGFGLYPAVKVYSLSSERLDEYDHYEVSYENNINCGVATATVKGVGEYSGVIEVNFNIVKKDIANLSFAEIPEVTYSGDAYTPDPVIYYGDILLVKDVDYTVSYSANVNIGKATITITGIGNYTGTKAIYFNISKNSTSFSVPVVGSQVYTGKAVTPDFNLFSGDKLLIKGVDYTVTYENNINVGYGRIIIKGIGNYSGTIVVIFRIVSTQISLATVPSFSDIAYSGNEFTPDFNANPITYGGKKLVEGVDFKVEIYNNRNAGTVKIVIIGIGNFTGTIVIYVNINAVDISGVTVSRIDDVEYNGAVQTPYFKVTKNGKTLVKGVDYTVEYRNNIFVGTATVVIKGIGNYKGEKSFTFRIVESTYYELVVTTESETLGYDSIMQVWAEINPYLEMNYTFIYESSNAKIASVDENGVVKALDEGEVVISVTVVDENGNAVLNPDGEEIRSEIRIRCTMTFWQKIIKFFRSIAAFFTNLFTFSIGLQMQ